MQAGRPDADVLNAPEPKAAPRRAKATAGERERA
jgi:hypothetical protein